MPLDASMDLGLADKVMAILREQFKGDHNPSAGQWDAIEDLARCLERAAQGSLDAALYLSALPAGTGKTATITAFARVMMESDAHSHVGMLIACNRVEEVAAVARAFSSQRDKACVIVGPKHPDVRAMGGQSEADTAQLVVTTQAALKASLRGGRSFDDAKRYHYQGSRRRVVAWDEALSFNRAVLLDVDTAVTLSKKMRHQSGEAADLLIQWSADLARAPTGPIAVPDFEGLGVDFPRLEDDVGDNEDQVAAAKMLSMLSGNSGWVLRENTKVSSLVHYVPELPLSLLPVIVTDASAAMGVHHVAYDQMKEGRRPIVRLKEALKTYRGLTIRLAPVAASRSVFREPKGTKAADLIDMVIRYIRSVGQDEVLVVTYGAAMRMSGIAERTIKEAIAARLTEEERKRVHHLSWGRHTASNEFKRVQRVVLLGLNFLPNAAHHAASAAALEKPMRSHDPEDHPSDEQIRQMKEGMLKDSTFQALLRGHARLGQDGDCGKMEALIFQSPQTGLSEQDWLGMFPGASIAADRSLMAPKGLTKKMQELSEIVLRRLSEGDVEMDYPSLYGALGMDRSAFGRLVRKDEWVSWMSSIGLAVCDLERGLKGFRLTA